MVRKSQSSPSDRNEVTEATRPSMPLREPPRLCEGQESPNRSTRPRCRRIVQGHMAGSRRTMAWNRRRPTPRRPRASGCRVRRAPPRGIVPSPPAAHRRAGTCRRGDGSTRPAPRHRSPPARGRVGPPASSGFEAAQLRGPAILPGGVPDHPLRTEGSEERQGPSRLVDQNREEVTLVPRGDRLEERGHVRDQTDLIDHKPEGPDDCRQVRIARWNRSREIGLVGLIDGVTSARVRSCGCVRQDRVPTDRRPAGGLGPGFNHRPNRPVRPTSPSVRITARDRVCQPGRESRSNIESPGKVPRGRSLRGRSRRQVDARVSARAGPPGSPRVSSDIGWSEATIIVILERVYEPATPDLQAASPGRGIVSRRRNRRISLRAGPVAGRRVAWLVKDQSDEKAASSTQRSALSWPSSGNPTNC